MTLSTSRKNMKLIKFVFTLGSKIFVVALYHLTLLKKKCKFSRLETQCRETSWEIGKEKEIEEEERNKPFGKWRKAFSWKVPMHWYHFSYEVSIQAETWDNFFYIYFKKTSPCTGKEIRPLQIREVSREGNLQMLMHTTQALLAALQPCIFFVYLLVVLTFI